MACRYSSLPSLAYAGPRGKRRLPAENSGVHMTLHFARVCHAICGTERAYGATRYALLSYAVCGTERRYGATKYAVLSSGILVPGMGDEHLPISY
eukprot:3623748-Rhodomonas_salina.1